MHDFVLFDSLWILKLSTPPVQMHQHAQDKIVIYINIYIPLISRVRGLYGKLWIEFFPSFYGPSAKHAGHENKEGKNEDS